MTAVRDNDNGLQLDFGRWERRLVRRSSLEVPFATIERIEVLPGWTAEPLGLRSGLVISGYWKLGTFRYPAGPRRLVSMRRGTPVLRITLRGRQAGDVFDELLISSQAAEEIAHVVRAGSAR
ncbi:hypothetical protein AB0F43_21675 [Kribbella sp. NPDC023972]|uniref:hypothetical protein n=1 Tax=Kribbella sp. NPDC023972 TaxID=3154795 RepID=UPI0033E86DE4